MCAVDAPPVHPAQGQCSGGRRADDGASWSAVQMRMQGWWHGRTLNVNIHYDARLAACIPATATVVLDVGWR